nr:hypothetical protein [Tepidiforma sp.]
MRAPENAGVPGGAAEAGSSRAPTMRTPPVKVLRMQILALPLPWLTELMAGLMEVFVAKPDVPQAVVKETDL